MLPGPILWESGIDFMYLYRNNSINHIYSPMPSQEMAETGIPGPIDISLESEKKPTEAYGVIIVVNVSENSW